MSHKAIFLSIAAVFLLGSVAFVRGGAPDSGLRGPHWSYECCVGEVCTVTTMYLTTDGIMTFKPELNRFPFQFRLIGSPGDQEIMVLEIHAPNTCKLRAPA